MWLSVWFWVSQCGLQQQSHVHVRDITQVMAELLNTPLKSTSVPILGLHTVYPGASHLSAPSHFKAQTPTAALLPATGAVHRLLSVQQQQRKHEPF